MSFIFTQVGGAASTNLTPATGAAAMYAFKQTLKNAGWTVPKSSDGTTYNSSGDQITSGGSGANGMANNSAWFVIASPDAKRAYCLQRGTTNLVWRMKYSPTNVFTGGSPSATQVPAAADEAVWLGGGTDAAPTFSGLYAADGGYRFSCGADNAVPYAFYSFAFPTGGSAAASHGFISDSMTTAPTNDTDQYVTFSYQGTLAVGSWNGTGNQTHASWQGTTNFQAQFNQSGSIISCGQPGNAGLMPDPVTGKDQLYAALVMIATKGFKGFTTSVLIEATGVTGNTRSTPTAITLVTTNDKIVVDGIALPWDGSSPTI